VGGWRGRNGGMAGFDSLMLTSTETISFMEGAAAGRMKETERDGRLICAEREHERERERERERDKEEQEKPAR